MRVAIINCSKVYNLAVDKIANYHRCLGDDVYTQPLELQDIDKFYFSAIFTSDIPKLIHNVNDIRDRGRAVEIGGPAATFMHNYIKRDTGIEPHRGLDERFEHVKGQYSFTFTSRGCPNHCSYCGVSQLEPVLEEYDEFALAPMIGDNNLLATSWKHQELVVEKFADYKRNGRLVAIDINSGFDVRLFERKHFQLYSRLKLLRWRFAFDEMSVERDVRRVAAMMKAEGFDRHHVTFYCLIGFPGTTPEECLYRLNTIIELGMNPYPMRFAPLNCTNRKYVARGFTQDLLSRMQSYYQTPSLWMTVSWEDFKPRKDRQSDPVPVIAPPEQLPEHFSPAPACRGFIRSREKELGNGGMMTELAKSTVVEWHDPADLIPHPLSLSIYGDDNINELVESIKAAGVLEPLYIKYAQRNKILIISGHRRWRAAKEIKLSSVPCIAVTYASELDEREAIIEHNRQRIKNGQQLYNEGKEIEIIEAERAAKRKAQAVGQPRGVKQEPSVEDNLPQQRGAQTRDVVAKKIGLGSGKQWDKLKAVGEASEAGDSKAKELLQTTPHKVSIHRAYKHVSDKKREKQIRAVKKAKLPEGEYHVVVIDPPWSYSKRPADVSRRGRAPYPQMSLEEITANKPPCADNCIVWLWTTNAFMHDAFHVLEVWGLESKTILTWVRKKFGVGDWLRGQTEHCIMAIKGRPVVTLTNESTVIYGEAPEHRKPEEFYKLVEALCPGTKVEMYARTERTGWNCYRSETKQIFDKPEVSKLAA